MKNIVLIGMMGSGKSTIGKLLSQTLTKEFVDSDDLIEEKEQRKITHIFEENGEVYFRELEAAMIEQVSEKENSILSTGGGVVLSQKNTENLSKNGVVFFLSGSGETLTNRLTDNAEDRPLLKSSDLKEKIEQLLGIRQQLYVNASDYIIEIGGKSPDAIVREIIDIYCKIQ